MVSLTRRGLVAGAAAVLAAPAALAQDNWPTRPIRIVVTFPPGGSSDIVARVLADVLSQRLPHCRAWRKAPGPCLPRHVPASR